MSIKRIRDKVSGTTSKNYWLIDSAIILGYLTYMSAFIKTYFSRATEYDISFFEHMEISSCIVSEYAPIFSSSYLCMMKGLSNNIIVLLVIASALLFVRVINIFFIRKQSKKAIWVLMFFCIVDLIISIVALISPALFNVDNIVFPLGGVFINTFMIVLISIYELKKRNNTRDVSKPLKDNTGDGSVCLGRK